MRALLVEDDPVSTTMLTRIMERTGIIVEPTDTGEDGLELVKLYDFDIAVVDLRLPDMHGAHFVRRMRSARVETPALIVSGVGDVSEKARALSCGADDYMTKPVDQEEFVARINAIIRRAKGFAASEIKVGRMTLNLTARSVQIDDTPLNVTGKEYTILELLALRKGQPLTKEAFLDHLYGGRDEPEQKIIDVFICKLRKKIAALNQNKHNIETVWGRGYVLNEMTKAQGASPGLAEEPATPFDLTGQDEAPVHPEPNEIELLVDLLDLK